MGSVVKIAAMVNPTAPARRKASPTLPPAVRVAGLIAMNKVAQLSAKERNARTRIQPCSPIAYSLMNRHDGSSSGLMTCTAASRTRNRAAAAQDTRAAVRELAAVGVAAAVPFEMPVAISPSPPSLATLTIDWQPLRRRRGEEGIAARWADPTASHVALGSRCPPRRRPPHRGIETRSGDRFVLPVAVVICVDGSRGGRGATGTEGRVVGRAGVRSSEAEEGTVVAAAQAGGQSAVAERGGREQREGKVRW